jgi:hypothetical protein
MIELESGTQPLSLLFAGPAEATLPAGRPPSGYGLLGKARDLQARQRARQGPSWRSARATKPLPPSRADGAEQVACLSLAGRAAGVSRSPS